MGKLEELVNTVEGKVSDSPDREISTTDIGEFLIERLRELDKIAYVRFASVYRDFQDEQAFFDELKTLMRQKQGPGQGPGAGGQGPGAGGQGAG
jgi:transcriptional repressor NrdR